MAKESKSLVIGVDVGGTKIVCGVVASSGKVLGRCKKKTKAQKGSGAVIDRIIDCIDEALEESRQSREDVAGVALGFPGPLDAEKGIVYCAPNLVGWDNFPLAKTIEKAFGVPAIIDNDVNLGTLGEFEFGAATGARHVIGIFVGTGIGGGIIIDGKLLGGRNGTAGEVGHMVIDLDGPKAATGVSGAFEALASRSAITRDILAAIRGGEKSILEDSARDEDDAIKLTSGDLKRAVAKDDKLVTTVLRRACKYLGTGIGSLVNIIGPDVVVVGGGVIEALGDFMIDLIRKETEKIALPNALKGVRIVPAKLGDDAVMMGAVAAAWRKFHVGGK